MSKNTHLTVFIVVLVLAALACQAMPGGLPLAQTTEIPGVVTEAAEPVGIPPLVSSTNMQEQERVLNSLYEHVTPGIVSILVFTDSVPSLGTGIVFDNLGHIVTNCHVVAGQKKIEVDFLSGFKTFGTLVGTDLDSDLAVIKVDAPAEELHQLTLGDSSQLKVGQTVIAIGNPFKLYGTMTTGIVSALGRSLEPNPTCGSTLFSASDLIQTDAAINPGNSGGPLFNLQGEVIGINRAIRSEFSNNSGEPVNSGIGFAIAINIIKRVVPEIIKNGKYDYPFMDISFTDDLTLDEINVLGLKQNMGVYVTSVTPGGPAEKAGLLAGSEDVGLGGLLGGGDLIIAVDGHPVKVYNDLLSYLVNNKVPGDTITLTILRRGEKVDVQLTLGKRP